MQWEHWDRVDVVWNPSQDLEQGDAAKDPLEELVGELDYVWVTP